MPIKEKVKSYSFWVSLASALVLILKVIGTKFGFNIDATLASDIITSLCSVLVITGIIVTPTSRANADLEILNDKPKTTTLNNQEYIATENTAEQVIENLLSTNNVKETISVIADNLKETATQILEDKNVESDNNLEPSIKTNACEEITEISTISQNSEAIVPTTTQCEKVVETTTFEPKTYEKSETSEVNEEIFNQNKEEVYLENSESNELLNSTLKNILTRQKFRYADNLDEYYKILLEEIKSIKPTE